MHPHRCVYITRIHTCASVCVDTSALICMCASMDTGTCIFFNTTVQKHLIFSCHFLYRHTQLLHTQGFYTHTHTASTHTWLLYTHIHCVWPPSPWKGRVFHLSGCVCTYLYKPNVTDVNLIIFLKLYRYTVFKPFNLN